MPSYSNVELREWILRQPNFDLLYNDWVKSGYKKELRPSVDRLDDYQGYFFGNIRLCGKNNKKSRSVYQIDLDGNIVKEFYSAKQAERDGIAGHQNISAACHGRLKKTGGFIWMYKDEFSEEEKCRRVYLAI